MSLDRAEPLGWTQLATSTGNAQLYIAPRADGHGAVPVLRLTPTNGNPIAFALTRAELRRIHAAAGRILEAGPAEIDDWLDQAAAAVLDTLGAGQ
jgi:hypothetical protein